MPRVLFVSHSAALDGAPKVLANLLSAFEKDAVQPLAIFPEGGPILQMVEKAGVPYRIIDVGHSGWKLHHVPLLQLLFRREKADCIHANTADAYPAVLAAKLAGIPVVWHIHEMLNHKQHYAFDKVDERLILKLVACSDRICVASEAGRHAFTEYCTTQRIDTANKLQVIHNGVSLPEAAPPPDRNRDFTITAIASIVRLKGFENLITAFARLQKRFAVKLQIVGKVFPSYFLELYKLAEELRVNEKVQFRTETSDIEEVYLKSHMIVCSSVIETFPMVVLEALSYGKPVVATRVGGIPEMVTDGVTGLLVPPEDPAALAKAMKYFMENWDEALQMGTRGRLRVAEEFSLTKQANEFTAVYGELAQGKTRGQSSPLTVDELEEILFSHMVNSAEKMSRFQNQLRETSINDLIRDMRTLENVVGNVLNRWPFRFMRAIRRKLVPRAHVGMNAGRKTSR